MRVLKYSAFLLAMIILTATPASADRRDNDIDDTLDEWIEYAEDLGYEIIETRIEWISCERSLFMELPPGEYHAYAEGGYGVGDLDMTVWGDWGDELGSDYLADNYPVVDFSIHEWQEVEFVLSDYEHDGWSDEGEFCFVLAREWGYDDRWGDRDDRWRDRDRWDYDRLHDDDHRRDYRRDRDNRGRWNRDDDRWHDRWDDDRERDRDRWYDEWDGWCDDWDDCRREWDRDDRSWRDGRDSIEERLDSLYDFAWDRGLYPIMDEIGQIHDTRIYDLELPRGTYVVMAAGGHGIEDLDLHVYWRNQWEVAEDIEPDASPAVWFHLPDRTVVEIEVEVWSFTDWQDEGYFCMLVCED